MSYLVLPSSSGVIHLAGRGTSVLASHTQMRQFAGGSSASSWPAYYYTESCVIGVHWLRLISWGWSTVGSTALGLLGQKRRRSSGDDPNRPAASFLSKKDPLWSFASLGFDVFRTKPPAREKQEIKSILGRGIAWEMRKGLLRKGGSIS